MNKKIMGLLAAAIVASISTDVGDLPVPPANPIVEAKPPVIDAVSLKCLAKNIYFEARNQSRDGMQAVGFVVMNRVSSPKFPKDICSVVKQAKRDSRGNVIRNKCHFSWFCDGKPDEPKNLDKWTESIIIASRIVHGYDEDNTSGATHYHASWMRKHPKWANPEKIVAQIDDHIFYQ